MRAAGTPTRCGADMAGGFTRPQWLRCAWKCITATRLRLSVDAGPQHGRMAKCQRVNRRLANVHALPAWTRLAASWTRARFDGPFAPALEQPTRPALLPADDEVQGFARHGCERAESPELARNRAALPHSLRPRYRSSARARAPYFFRRPRARGDRCGCREVKNRPAESNGT